SSRGKPSSSRSNDPIDGSVTRGWSPEPPAITSPPARFALGGSGNDARDEAAPLRRRLHVAVQPQIAVGFAADDDGAVERIDGDVLDGLGVAGIQFLGARDGLAERQVLGE